MLYPLFRETTAKEGAEPVQRAKAWQNFTTGSGSD